MNPLDIIKMIKNPKEYVMNYANKNTNPILKNLIDNANKGNQQEVENIANNILRQQGTNLDEIKKLLK